MRSFLLPLYQFRFLRLGLLLGFSFLFLMNPYDNLAQNGNYKIEKLQNEPLFLYKADKDGTIRCELAKQEEIQQYILSQPKVFNYTIVKSLNPESVRGMKILLRERRFLSLKTSSLPAGLCSKQSKRRRMPEEIS